MTDFLFRNVDPSDVKEVLMTDSKGTCSRTRQSLSRDLRLSIHPRGETMNKKITAGAVGLLGALVMAPAAHADESSYLAYLQNAPYLVKTHSTQQLIDEGYKVCRAMSQGKTDVQALDMVDSDLGVSEAAGAVVYSAATAMLGC
jgi:hypothetical protein